MLPQRCRGHTVSAADTCFKGEAERSWTSSSRAAEEFEGQRRYPRKPLAVGEVRAGRECSANRRAGGVGGARVWPGLSACTLEVINVYLFLWEAKGKQVLSLENHFSERILFEVSVSGAYVLKHK